MPASTLWAREERPVTAPKDILDFWFGAPGSPEHGTNRQEWFKKSDAFDAEIRRRFAKDVDAAIDGGLEGWAQNAEGALALIILLDQFPRNIFRNSGRSFAGDARALETAKRAIACGFDEERAKFERVFFYLPFEHSEDLADQDRCIALVSALGDDNYIDYAHRHRDIVARFGRFPHRNALLGRASTDEEIEFLKQPNSSF
jgi:uncharacterized protein (DUF924 family)